MKVQQGFTLIELMVVVAIIGIIAAVAYPSYGRYVMEARRSDAHTALLNMADRQERFYLQNNTYSANIADLITGAPVSPENYYTLSVSNVSASTYTLTATPVGAQLSDAACNPIELTHAGQKTPALCWQ